MSEGRGMKRPKSYYRKSSHGKRQRLNTLAAGMKGFLVTCNTNEKGAVRECYNILNEYADELYGSEQVIEKTDTISSDQSDDDDEDMEKAMAKEVKVMKDQQLLERRFQNTDSRAKNCIFIRTTLEEPSKLHHKIFSDLYEKKVSKARFAIRMWPILGTCKASIEELKLLAEDILPKYFSSKMGQDKSYAVNFKARNNSSMRRDVVFSTVGEIIRGLNPLNKVNCDHPEISVFVEIICNVCCLGVGTDFYKFKKYNLHEVVKDAKNELSATLEAGSQPPGVEVSRTSLTDIPSRDGGGDVHDNVCASSDGVDDDRKEIPTRIEKAGDVESTTTETSNSNVEPASGDQDGSGVTSDSKISATQQPGDKGQNECANKDIS